PGIGVAEHATLGEYRRKIVEREHRVNARQRQRAVRVDPAERGVGMLTAHERRVPRPGTRDVVDEAALADEQGAVLEARNARSDQSTHVPTISLITFVYFRRRESTHKASYDRRGWTAT